MKNYFKNNVITNNFALFVVFMFIMALSYITKLEKIKIISSIIVPLLCIPYFFKEIKNKEVKEKIKIIAVVISGVIIFLLVINNTKNSILFDNVLLPLSILLTATITFASNYFKQKKLLYIIPILWIFLIIFKSNGGV